MDPLTPEALALLPHDSRGPALIIVSWVLTGLATAFLALRIYCKHIGRRGLWWDDWVLIAAWVVMVIDSALATHMVVYYTYGRHSWDFRPPSIDEFVLVTAVRATFTVTCIVWTKTAFAITLLRITDGWMKLNLWFIIISMNILMGLSGLFFWIQCTPIPKSWTPSIREGSCLDPDVLMILNITTGAYSAAMDFILALLPWKILHGLHMKKKEKMGIAITMSIGFVAGIAGIVKTVKLPKLGSHDTYDAADLVIWDITEAAVTMIAACLPVLRILVRDLRSTVRYAPDDPMELQNVNTGHGWKAGSTVESKTDPFSTTHKVMRNGDDRSDRSNKSMLDGFVSPKKGRIVRTDEVAINYRARRPEDAYRNDYGLGGDDRV